MTKPFTDPWPSDFGELPACYWGLAGGCEDNAGEGAMNWQPIETAPKDGTWMLLHFNEYRVPIVTFWMEDNEGAGWWFEGHKMHGEKPTHWQPLPEPPR